MMMIGIAVQIPQQRNRLIAIRAYRCRAAIIAIQYDFLFQTQHCGDYPCIEQKIGVQEKNGRSLRNRVDSIDELDVVIGAEHALQAFTTRESPNFGVIFTENVNIC